MLSINKTNAFILNICPTGWRSLLFASTHSVAKLGHWGCWWRHLPVFVVFAVCSSPMLFFDEQEFMWMCVSVFVYFLLA